MEAFLSVFAVASALMLFHTAVGYPYLLRQSVQNEFKLDSQVNALLGSSLVIAAGMAAVVLLSVSPINALLTAGKPTIEMQESVVWLAPLLIFSVGSAPLRGALNLRGYVILPLALQVSTFAVLALSVWVFPDHVKAHITQTYVLLLFVEVIVTYFFAKGLLNLRIRLRLTVEQLKSQFKACQWLLLGFVLQSILVALDIPTAALAGEGAVTIFQSVFRVPFLMMWSVSGVIGGLLGAVVTQRENKHISAAELQSTLKTALHLSGWATLVSVAITSFLVYKGLAGAPSADLFIIGVLSALMVPCWTITSILSKFLDIWDKQHHSPVIYLIVLLVRIVIAYPLIKTMGLIGVAVTLLVGQLALFLSHWFFLRAHLPKLSFAIFK